MDIVYLLAAWIFFCLGGGVVLMFFLGLSDCMHRKMNAKWYRELCRMEDNEQSRLVSRQK